MEILKKVLWDRSDYGNEEDPLIIDADSVKRVAQINSDEEFLIYNVDTVPDQLNEKLKQYIDDHEDDEEIDFAIDHPDGIESFLKSIGFDDAEVRSEDYPEIRDQLVYSCYDRAFNNLLECEETKIYRFWDGNNWRTIELNEVMIETIVEITKDYVDLDEWDGRNFKTGGLGEHQRIHKVITVDGDEVDEMYLLWYSSQWQSVLDKACILESIDKVREHIEELGDRDISKYLFEIGKLEGKSFPLSLE